MSPTAFPAAITDAQASDPAARQSAQEVAARARAIDALLPQTQCRQCGFAGCLPYAQAIAAGAAPINRCPPGGSDGIAALAHFSGQAPIALDPDCGTPRPLHVARIDESRCIGCTLCIQACPVDAIVGGSKRMHTVLAADCTGCDLCLPPCPMDCIEMIPVQPMRAWTRADADRARTLMHLRQARVARERQDNEARLTSKALHKLDELRARKDLAPEELVRRQQIVERALARVAQRRADTPDTAALGEHA